MHLDSELTEELNLLMRFGDEATSEAVEIFPTSDPMMVAAVQRLFDKGLVSQRNGGYLTESGLQAVDYINRLENLLAPPLEPI